MVVGGRHSSSLVGKEASLPKYGMLHLNLYVYDHITLSNPVSFVQSALNDIMVPYADTNLNIHPCGCSLVRRELSADHT